MKVKTFLSLAIIAATAIIFTACNGKSEQQSAQVSSAPSETIVDNKDETTFLSTFLEKYITLSDKQAQDLARQYLTEDFYSRYIEQCSNKDDAVDLIMELAIDEKAEKIDTIMKGIEDPSSFIVQIEAKGVDGKPFSTQYDMTVVNENGKYKLGDSQIND